MEIGSLRALMRKHRLWADIQPDVKMPRGREDVGEHYPRTRNIAF